MDSTERAKQWGKYADLIDAETWMFIDKTNASYDSLVTMVNHLKAVDDMSRSIATASEQQSAVAKDVAVSIVEISDVAKNIATNAQNASENSENLLKVSEGQSKLIGQFKIS